MRTALIFLGFFASVAFGAADAPEDPLPGADGGPVWFSEASALISTNAAEAQKRGESELAAARAAQDRRGEILALTILAGARRRLNDLPAALAQAKRALQLAEAGGDPRLLATARDALARASLSAGDAATAIEYLLLNLATARQEKSLSMEVSILHILGAAYERLGNRERVREIREEVLVKSEALGDREAVATAAANLSISLTAAHDFEGARRCLNRALAVRRELGNRTAIADVEEHLAEVDLEEGKPQAALPILQRTLANRRTLRGRLKLTDTLRLLSYTYLALGRIDEALNAVEEARGYAEAIESHRVRAAVFRQLAAVQEARGDFKAALETWRREMIERTAMAGEASQQRVAELQTRFDVAQKNEELARLARDNEVQAARLAQNAAEIRASEAELARAHLQRYTLAAGVGMATLLLGTIVLAQRSRLRASRRAQAETEAARRAAEEATALKTRLLGVVSHDLRTPLRTLSLRAQSLRDAPRDAALVEETALRIDAESTRLLRLVHDLLDVSAIEQGGVALRRSPHDLGSFVARVVEAQQPRAALRGVRLTFHPAAASPLVPIDAARLEQALVNLLDNALKFTPAGRAVDVSIRVTDTDARIAIRDEGPGIGPAELSCMFQPFSAGQSKEDSNEPSTGLGLYISREMVARHGGRLEVRSQPGEGATFEIVLPLRSPTTETG